MNIFDSDTLRLILIFFVPGFISMKVYDLYIPSERRDFSKSLLEAVSFSLFNFAILFWFIAAIHSDDFPTNHPFWYYVFFLLIVFVAPMVWTTLYILLLNSKILQKWFVHPVSKPWDYLFGKKQSYWVIVHMKDGRRIGGRYDTNSFSSSYPAPEQIYLEELWRLDEAGRFLEKVERSHGIIISASEFQSIEFFQ